MSDLVQQLPAEAAPRERLAQFYVLIGDKAQAVVTLDALGELQIGAGDKEAASKTVRRIIALNPPNVEDYGKLLQQIED